MSTSSLAVHAGDMLEGRYKLITTIGEGGMGTVFLAEHTLIQRKVAIKILRPDLAADTTVVERFMNEARAAGAIGHPHIVESTDMGFTRDGVPFIVFEYLEGALLTDEIYRVRGMPPRRALRIATQIASALDAAHNAGIVHRDLKSDNIFLTDRDDHNDHVKVLDFGISRFMEGDDAADMSRHLVMGTPEFMAPEQILTPERVDKRADIYALGVVLYEMLAARRPFDVDEEHRTDTDQLLHKIVTEPMPTTGRTDLPPRLEPLIRERLLAKDPDDRFQSMAEVEAALEALLRVARRDSEPVPIASAAPAPSEVLPASGAAAALSARRASGLGWLVAALALGGAGGALLLVEQQGSKQAAAASSHAAQQALDDAAAKLATTLDTQAQAAHMRAEGIASLPMLRAAIETDAATLADMVMDRDVLFKAQPDEVLEIFQIRRGTPSTMLRIPITASALEPVADNATRLDSDGSRLHLVVGTPVVNHKGANQGSIALSTPVDLSLVEQQLAPYTKSAAIVGLAKPLVLAGSPPPAGAPSLPIRTSAKTKLSGLSLAAVLDAPAANTTSRTPTLQYARFACWGLAGLLLVMFGIGRARRD